MSNLAPGDKVKVTIKSALPNEDGWGKTLQGNPPTQYEIREYEGTVVLSAPLLQVKIDGWATFPLEHFEKIEEIEMMNKICENKK